MINIPLIIPALLSYRGFKGTIEWDPESQMFHGESAGIITYASETARGLPKAFVEAVDAHLPLTTQINDA